MSMRVGVFVPDNNMEHSLTLLAFAAGITRVTGRAPTMIDLNNTPYEPYDVAVVFGVGKKGMPISYPRARVIAGQKDRNLPVIVIEKGYVKRDKYYAVGLGGLNGRADFKNKGMPGDRWDALGVELKPWKESNFGDVVICGQVPTDASVQHVDFFGWCSMMIEAIKKRTNDLIVFRPHPLALDRTPAFIGTKRSSMSLDDDIARARLVVTFNSNIAVDAAIAGVPVFAYDSGSMAMPIANCLISQINNPVKPEREQWAHNLAYTQWTHEEMENGLPWLHIMREING